MGKTPTEAGKTAEEQCSNEKSASCVLMTDWGLTSVAFGKTTPTILFLHPTIQHAMIIKRLSILNFKNIGTADLTFSPKLNCLFGLNGMGKTNLLDAIYYLSFCKSSINHIDSQNIKHDADFFMIDGTYDDGGNESDVYCGLKKRHKKIFKRNGKEYKKFSEHIGQIPLVIISPADGMLIAGGSEERRRFIDMVISQHDKQYLNALIRYEKALMQRNAMLKVDVQAGDADYEIWEEMMAIYGKAISDKRSAFIDEFIGYFNELYSYISSDNEAVSLNYTSHCLEGDLRQQLADTRERDKLIGFTTRGTHRDDLEMLLGGYPIRKEGSQGQNKTFIIALKLAQYTYLDRKGLTRPLLLLDDIFDRLDGTRVEKIVRLVAGDAFGQIFITDTDRRRFDPILDKLDKGYKIFNVNQGDITPEE